MARIAAPLIQCICRQCGESFDRRPYQVATGGGQYCSQTCYHQSRYVRVDRQCEVCGIGFTAKRCDVKRGWGRFCSKKCLGVAKMGANNPLWRGGVSPENHRIREQRDYRAWRKAIFERDDWTCQECHQRGGSLHAHHVFGFADYEEHRFSVWNGVTLCVSCHAKTHPELNLNRV